MRDQTANQMTMLVATLAASICCSVHQSWAEEVCPSEATLRSVASTQHTRISFLNGRSRVVNVFWIDYNGRRYFYHSLESGESQSFDTYATHPWVVTDASGNCIGVYFADVGENHIAIGN
jgi:VHL beta domain